jgi:hypothetical protein
MALIVVVMALVALFANWQRSRRDQLETFTISPVSSPAAAPASTPTAEATP